jgi:hypothetical protein
MEHFRTETPKEWFGEERLKDVHRSGARLFSKGPYGMGLCEFVNAPCMYLTVLRDPVERFISHWRFSCLAREGEVLVSSSRLNHEGKCRMGLLEWYDYLNGDDWLHLLAPGKGSEDAQLATAIKNLDKSCVRFLLTEKFEDGFNKLTFWLPDFRHHLNVTQFMSLDVNMNEAPELSADDQVFFDHETSHNATVNELHRRLRREIALYRHAKRTYEKKWQTPMRPC